MVTILVPNFNNAVYLDDFFSSLIAQTFKNFKVLFSDDCSTDNSVSIAESYQDRLNIEIIKTPKNLHLVGNLNFAIKKIQTKYFIKIDPDDYIEKNAIQLVLSKAESENLDICGCQLRTFGKYKTSEQNPIDLEEIYLITSLFPCVAQFLFKTEVFENLSYREVKGAEDFDFWIQAVKSGLKIGAVNVVLLNYRIHNTNATVVLKESIDRTVISVRKQAILLNYQCTIHDLDLLSEIPSFGATNIYELTLYKDFIMALYERNSIKSKIFKRCLAKWFLRICLVSSNNVGFSTFVLFKKTPEIFHFLSRSEVLGLFVVSFFGLNEKSNTYIKLKSIFKRLKP
ncbi:glycosyltransferase family 2 protein [Shewanella baltica]|uniref:glycosyltransferase family 2 protein n=1 Tax=Shewanella baltica TaxID=62322 RepID=UPI003D79FCA5